MAGLCLEGKGPFKLECLDLDGNSQRGYSRELSRLLSKMGNYGTPYFQGENLCTLAPGRVFRKRLRQRKCKERKPGLKYRDCFVQRDRVRLCYGNVS